MIVKNESKVIRRLLESVVDVIDSYCICDTGSTDNTIEIIETFFHNCNPPILGKIIQEPFRDFGYNRTFSLKACESMTATHILLLDADMVLQIHDRDALINELMNQSADVFYIFQGLESFFYKNIRVVRNNHGCIYWGVTHEYVSTPPGTDYKEIDIATLFINDIGDGGAKTDKFERDIRLLTKGLEENPGNDRYTFYLANSYRDAGHKEKAIDTFKKRIAIGGWIEEVWHSHYNIGNCYRSLGEMEKAVSAWMEAFQAHPKRIESLYEIVRYYREQGKNELAYLYYRAADKSRAKWGASNDFLFLQKDVYDYKLDYEMSVIGYYANHDAYPLPNISMKVLTYPHLGDYTIKSVLSNYKFYASKLIDKSQPFNQPFMTIATDSLNILDDTTFVKSTPSFIIRENNLIMNVRYVNYRIDEHGNYINHENIITKNAIAVLDISKKIWQIVQEFELVYDTSKDGRYIGLEDIRLMIHNKKILYNANRGIQSDMTVEHGEISLAGQSTRNSEWPVAAKHSNIEKNWVLLPSEKENPTVVYHWNPELILGEFQYSKFKENQRQPVPAFFKSLRGSTNGVVIKDEIWVICHIVSYEDRRYYYHIMVALDKMTYAVRRYTSFFTFEGAKVEYTLGFAYLEGTDQILIGYSLYDKCAKYMMVTREEIENRMISL